MRKGSTSLGSVGVISTGIALLILPLFPGAAGILLTPAPGWAAGIGAPAEALQRAALERRRAWLAPVRRAEAARRPARKAGSREVLRVIHTRATWYGPGFHGRRTASGERFNRHAMTMASRHLPLGARVRVTNPRTGRSAVARVNDRGPYSHRSITADLSQGLARKIGLRGTGPVRIEVLSTGRKSR